MLNKLATRSTLVSQVASSSTRNLFPPQYSIQCTQRTFADTPLRTLYILFLSIRAFQGTRRDNWWLVKEGTLMGDNYQPGELAKRLFFTNAYGEDTDPDTAIGVALEGAWEWLEPEAAALLGDNSAGEYDRFLALSALARWASPTGYEAVCAAATDPDTQPWRGMSIDRLHSLDNTFALLTESVVNSRDEAGERGTSAERLTALAALISITHRVYFEHILSTSGLYNEDIEELSAPIKAQIERSLSELAAAQAPLSQFVHDQAEELIDALGRVDKGAADVYKARLNGQ